MGKKRDNTSNTSADVKRKKGPKIIPLPQDAPSDEEAGGSDYLSDDDLELLHADHASLQFLHNLPRKAIDKAVSEPRKQESKASLKKRPPLTLKEAEKQTRRTGNLSDSGSGGEDSGEDGSEDSQEGVQDGNDEEGEAWERGPRRSRATHQGPAKAGPLPIKSLGGEVITDSAKLAAEHAAPIALAIPGVTVQDDLEEALKKKAIEEERRKIERQEAAAKRATAAAAAKHDAAGEDGDQGIAGFGVGSVLKDFSAYDSLEQRREEAKRTMAVAAQSLLGDPEGQVTKQLRLLLSMLGDPDAQVARLAMLSLLAVMRDLIPGYRIRPPSEREQDGVVVSKDVRKLWDFEAALLKAYQVYLKALLDALKASKSGNAAAAHGRIAAKCMASLLSSAPHFNYASDLLQAVVPNMASKDDQIRAHCCGAVATLLRSALGTAESGSTAVEAVQLVADLVKRRKCVAPPEVVECLLELSFPELASAEDFEAAKAARKKKKKKGKGKKDDVDRAFLEAQAVTDRDTRRHQQSSTLEALFEVFFRVMKTATASGLVGGGPDGPPMPAARFAKRFPLLGPTMEGLSKFAHLISVEYFQDMMAVLEQMLGSPALPPADRLRCLLTASDILRGQGEALTIDRRMFYMQLYSALTRVSLAPLLDEDGSFAQGEEEEEEQARTQGGRGGSSGGGSNSNISSTRHKANGPTSTTMKSAEEIVPLSSSSAAMSQLLTQVLEAMILNSKLLDASRQAAFAKRAAATAAASGDSGAAMGLLCVLQRMLRRQPKLRGMLDNEAGGPSGFRTFRADLEDPAEAGALAVPFWELALLSVHYHPHVAQAARDIARMNVSAAEAAAAGNGSGGGGSAVLPLGTLPTQLAQQYSTALGGFRPPPKAPSGSSSGGGGGQRTSNANGPPQQQESKGRAAQRKRLATDESAQGAFLVHVSVPDHTTALLPVPLVVVPKNSKKQKKDVAKEKEKGPSGGLSHSSLGGHSDIGENNNIERVDTEIGLEGALKGYYKVNRQFEKNRELRREHGVLAAKLRMFHERLQQRQKEKEKEKKKADKEKKRKKEKKEKKQKK